MPVASTSLLIACLAWTTVAFGGVYPWAYWPMVAGIVLFVGSVGAIPHFRKQIRHEPLLLPLGATLAAIALQLVPLPGGVRTLLSPMSDWVLRAYDLSFNGGTARPLSIHPPATFLALALAMALASACVALSAALSFGGRHRLATALMFVGLLVALIGIIQRPFFTGKIYGFWEPTIQTNSFGPFVNPNHFAGWMAMLLPLVLGTICGHVQSAAGRQSFRDYLVSDNPAASKLVVAMLVATVMGLSLVLSLSRAGIACFLLSCSATLVFISRRQHGLRRIAAVSYVVAMTVGVIALAGASTVASEFGATDWSQVQGRMGVWGDAASVARAFPLTGTGVNTYGIAMLFYQGHDTRVHYSAAHNDYLQVLAEGGLLLAVPVTWALVILIRTVRARLAEDQNDPESYWIRLGAVTGLAAIGIQEIADFSLQIPANALLFAILSAIAVHRSPVRAKRHVVRV
jgi:O-antigen ligase